MASPDQYAQRVLWRKRLRVGVSLLSIVPLLIVTVLKRFDFSTTAAGQAHERRTDDEHLSLEMELSAENAIIDTIEPRLTSIDRIWASGNASSVMVEVPIVHGALRRVLQESLELNAYGGRAAEEVVPDTAMKRLPHGKKLGFLFIVKDCLAVESLWIRFFEGVPASNYAIFVHFDGLTLEMDQADGLVPIPFMSPQARSAIQGDIHYLPSAPHVARFSVPLARLVTFMSRMAYALDKQIECFIPISDSSIPIRSFSDIQNRLLSSLDGGVCRSEMDIERLDEDGDWSDKKGWQWYILSRQDVRLIQNHPNTIIQALEYLQSQWLDVNATNDGSSYGALDEHLVPTLLTHLYSLEENRHLLLPSERKDGLIRRVTETFWRGAWEEEGRAQGEWLTVFTEQEREDITLSMTRADGSPEQHELNGLDGHPVYFAGDLLATLSSATRLTLLVSAWKQREAGLFLRKLVLRYDDRERLSQSGGTCTDIRNAFDAAALPDRFTYSGG